MLDTGFDLTSVDDDWCFEIPERQHCLDAVIIYSY
jgi:hypothetical protein